MFTKTLKKAMAFVLMIVFALTLVPISGMAASAAKNDWLWTGDDTPAFRNGTKSDNSSYKTELEYSDGIFGKASSDMVYKIYDTGTKHDLSQWGDFTLSGGNSSYSDYAIEFSFAFPTVSDSIGFNTQVYVDYSLGTYRTYSNFFAIYADYVYLANQKYTKDASGNNISFEAGKWYNVSLVVDAENNHTATNSAAEPASSYTHKLYINGELFAYTTKTPGTYNKDDVNTYRIYSDRTIRLGTDSLSATAYFDNIIIRNIDDAASYTPADADLSTLSSNNESITISGKNISIPSGAKVGALRQALVSSGANDNIRIFNSDYTTELLDSDLASDVNVVVASPRVYSESETRENTYAYYTTSKAYKTFGGMLLDATSIGTEIASGTQTLVNVTDGSFGKYDKVYEFSSVSDGSISSGTGYHPEPFAIISESDTSRKVLEFSCMLPQGSRGVRLICHCWGCDHGGNSEPSLAVTPDGVKVLYSTPNVIPYNFEYNKWYNVAIVLAGKTESEACSNDVEVYVNGEKIGSTTMNEVLGIRRLRVAAVSTSDEKEVFAYLDNIRLYDTSYVNAEYDVEDAIAVTGFEIDDKADKFYITSETQVSDIKAAVFDIKEDTSVNVISATGEIMADDAVVTEACTVVISAMNETASVRTVSYYDIENIADEFVIKTPEYTVTNTNVSAVLETINNTDSDMTAYAILAVYNSERELDKLVPVECVTSAGQNGYFADGISVAYNSNDTVKFFVWESPDTNINPLMPAEIVVD